MIARPVAELRVRGDSRVLVAETCTLDGPLVHATGRWRRRVGADWSEVRWSDERSYTWPLGELQRVRWLVRAADRDQAGAHDGEAVAFP